MKLKHAILVAAVTFSFLAADAARANEEEWGGRVPSSAQATKKKKKAKGKAATSKKSTKKTAKTSKKTPKKSAKRAAGAPPKAHGAASKSHYPTQPNQDAGGLPELSNEQKDDLPPPQNTEPKEE